MLLKYKALAEAIDHFLDVKGLSSATKLLILSNTGPDNEYDTLLEVLRELKLFADVTVALQSQDESKIPLSKVRFYFDKILEKRPELDDYLGDKGRNVHNPQFEVPLLRSEEQRTRASHLLGCQKKKKKQLQKEDEEGGSSSESEVKESFIESINEEYDTQVLKKAKTEFPYKSTNHCVSTSVMVKTLFSRCGIIMRPHRRCMDPSTLERLVFLRSNKDLWGEEQVDQVMKSSPDADAIVSIIVRLDGRPSSF